MAGTYASDPEWDSIQPIPLDDGSDSGAMPLATIAYAPEYLEVTSYLRAVMAANEMSERALKLTEDVITMNPAHYTVWIYRAKILFALEKDLTEELEWLNTVSLKYLKNYQIWHHRQVLMTSKEHFPVLPATELDFLMEMFGQDSKNYHVWTYRHWLVRHFKLWDTPRETQDVDTLLTSDVRNNSAWNHRFMLRFGPRGDNEPDAGMPNSNAPPEEKGKLPVVDEDLVDMELEYAKSKIVCAPENRSPWAYARGVFRAAGRSLLEWKEFANAFVAEKLEDGKSVDVEVKSTHALEWLADVHAQEDMSADAVRMLTLLKEKYDPIRKNYWDYRINMVEGHSSQNVQVAASA
ncbi:CAAX geranylgeranyltransferase alpha subunit [Aspergillus nanangensis]|uniref:Protein farnesyltransferase/geranylgeranyltransferase type-1 subunit alpha n=1 Tax=Aspergillus nanangensis TaxID=2582783 RepID=A0AAD4CNC3_ASPNN|nr:CAAX geranylgeranyltransferase alpha subunit [Aspergillus nanangensis]